MALKDCAANKKPLKRGLAAADCETGSFNPGSRSRPIRWQDLHTLVMHSDGISQHWSPDDLAGSAAHSPAITCAALVRAAASGRDDAGALAVGLSA